MIKIKRNTTAMFMTIPEGYLWFIPVYYLKLLTGFTAREELIE